MSPIGVKLWENAFQTIPDISFFDAPNIFILIFFQKFGEEPDGEVHWQPNPQNPNDKRIFFSDRKFSPTFFSVSKNEMSGIV